MNEVFDVLKIPLPVPLPKKNLVSMLIKMAQKQH